jgi:hypothetical protein
VRDHGAGARATGPGSGSGGDVDTDFVGVGTGGSGIATSGVIGRPPGPDDSDGSSDEFAAGGHAEGRNQTGVGKVGGVKRVAGTTHSADLDASTSGDAQGGDAATNPRARADDAFAGEISTGEAQGQGLPMSPSSDTQGLAGDNVGERAATRTTCSEPSRRGLRRQPAPRAARCARGAVRESAQEWRGSVPDGATTGSDGENATGPGAMSGRSASVLCRGRQAARPRRSSARARAKASCRRAAERLPDGATSPCTADAHETRGRGPGVLGRFSRTVRAPLPRGAAVYCGRNNAKQSKRTARAEQVRAPVGIYQIAGDELFLENRIDGTGWDWGWADWRRDWMDETPSKFAYRCLPLTIANQTGWFVRNPVGFTATWRGRPEAGAIDFLFDTNAPTWAPWINNQFGQGVITWNTPFLFRTKPEGSRLLIIGPANSFKHAIQPLTAIIESDWISMSFTMNWKFTAAHVPVRFEVGEPLFQASRSARTCAPTSSRPT